MIDKIDKQRLLITIGFVVLTATLVGSATWYFMNRSAEEASANYEKQINELRSATGVDETNTDSGQPLVDDTADTVGSSNVPADYKSLFELSIPTDWIATTNGQYFFHPKGTTISDTNLPTEFFRVWPPSDGGHGGPSACMTSSAPAKTTVTYDGFKGTKEVCSGGAAGTAIIYNFTEKIDKTAKATNSESGYLTLWFEFKREVNNVMVTNVMNSLNIK